MHFIVATLREIDQSDARSYESALPNRRGKAYL